MTKGDDMSNTENDSTLTCPFCGSDNVHIGAVEVNAGGVVTKVFHQYPEVSGSPKQGRGSLVLLRFWGECGHAWYWQIYFYKGQTMVEAFQDDRVVPSELWRD